jgi:hypothetical protein
VTNFEFQGVDGQTYSLPTFADAVENTDVDAGSFMDAMAGDEKDQLVFGIKLLRRVDAPGVEALRALPLMQGVPVIAEWFNTGAITAPE